MAFPEIENSTPFRFEPLFMLDEESRLIFVPLVKATFSIDTSATVLALADEQWPILLAGETYGAPEQSSYRFEPEGGPPKHATDVALVGHAVAASKGTTDMFVGLKVGPLKKVVRVVGDRLWFKSLGQVSMTRPAVFERIPLQYERAFGGWDRSHPDPVRHESEPRNPVGVGYRAKGSRFEEGLKLPNLEEPERPISHFGQRVLPAGFGFVSPGWEPRVQYAGTYGADWEKMRAPLLPTDFDHRFYNAASPGLVATGYLQGDESVAISGASTVPLAFRLPGEPPPQVVAIRPGNRDERVSLTLDTVILDTDQMQVYLLWRGRLSLAREPAEVRSILVKPGPGGLERMPTDYNEDG